MSYQVSLHLDLTDVDGQEEAIKKTSNTLLTVLHHGISECSVDTEVLEQIALADANTMGGLIEEWQDRAGVRRGYTTQHGGEFATAGKTIGRVTDSGEIKSSIVILSNLVYGLIDVIAQNVELEDWSADQQFWLYIPAHELGHATDNSYRKSLSSDEIDLAEERDLDLLSKHSCDVLVSEFLACYYSGPVVSSKLQEHFIEMFHDNADNLIESAIRQKNAMTGNTFIFASHNLWFVMTDFAKMLGHCCSNPDLPVPRLWDDADPDETTVFEKLEYFLRTELAPWSPKPSIPLHRSQDPEYDLEAFALEHLRPIWEKFCNCYGLYFDSEDDNDDDDL